MLEAHLQLEHQEFYPAFLAKVEGDAAAQTVHLFHQNLARIADGVLGARRSSCWRAAFGTKSERCTPSTDGSSAC